jgi:hypothetical protein
MKKKQKLTLEDLEVESFVTGKNYVNGGLVYGGHMTDGETATPKTEVQVECSEKSIPAHDCTATETL